LPLLALALLLAACNAGDTDTITEPVCEYGSDWTCNDNPMISSIHGQCEEDGTCTCFEEFGGKNPETGLCY
ncbi:MAG: hypothetical protein JRJ84_22175, partial [Deltaproteobacteria bacterium]|nr:hypothetical protein [Deltaproteobacteria bacterium]